MTGDAEIRYAKSGDAHIAYKVRGEGPLDLVVVPDWLTNQDQESLPELARFYERLATFTRLVSYDQRGSGLSDPVSLTDLPTLESWMDDLRLVIETAGADKPALLAADAAGPVAMLFAATFPEHTRALVLVNTFATPAWSADYPPGVRPEKYDQFLQRAAETWGTGAFLRLSAPSIDIDDERVRLLARMERQAASPASAVAILRMHYSVDVRAILPSIRVPTLVLHSALNRYLPVGHGRFLADHIPGARLVELPCADQAPQFTPAAELMTDEIQEFLTGVRPASDQSRVLATLLFTDVVASTDRAVQLGDRAWAAVLDRHDAMVRRQLARFSGKEVKLTGDGFLATFGGPARAIQCGCAIRDGARQIGLDVRVGVHTGEVELRGPELSGIAVHIAKRVCEAAEASEVLVSRTVVDLVAGSGLDFEERGEHELKGVPGVWRLKAVR